VSRAGIIEAARSWQVRSQTKLGHQHDLWAAAVDLWTDPVQRHPIGGRRRRLQKRALQDTAVCSMVMSVYLSVCLPACLPVCLSVLPSDELNRNAVRCMCTCSTGPL